MGLDWNPGNRPGRGYESEFSDLLLSLKSTNWTWSSTAAEARYGEISITAYDTLRAPTVGIDSSADEWANSVHNPSTHGPLDEFLTEMSGFRVVPLCDPCDGIPPYSNGSPGGYVEPFSFRGQFLADCTEVIGQDVVDEAWNNKLPKELRNYGIRLLDAVGTFASGHHIDIECAHRNKDPESREFHVDVVVCAGKWCLYRADREHFLDAYF